MLIRTVDFETRGPMPPHEENEIVEIGWCDVEDGIVAVPGSVLVRHALPIDIETMAIHHLQERDFADASSLEAAFMHLAEDGGAPDAWCAHSIKFERACWPDAPEPWICTYKCALRLWPDSPRHSNQVLRYSLGLTDLDPALAMPPHRAGPDAYVTAHILAKCLERAPVEDLIRWSGEPAILPRVTFGRQRGVKWSEVDDGFLEWVAARDFDEDVLFTVRTEMERRKIARIQERQDALAALADSGPDDEVPF